MTPTDTVRLRRECEVFCRYLVRRAPSDYILEKYCQAHERSADYSTAGAFDNALLDFATRGPAFAQFADSYACLFARYSAFRRKLILLFAILESASPRHGFSDAVDGSGQPVLFVKIAFRGVLFALRLLLACLLFVTMKIGLGGPPAPAGKGH
jgi:hypothetical protein